MKHLLLRCILSLCVASTCSSTTLHAGVDEPLLKAEFIKRFASFASWPPPALTPQDNIVFCIAGESSVTHYLKEIAKRERIKGRRVEVRQIKVDSGAQGCHLLYYEGRDIAALRSLLEKVRGTPLLTISDHEDFGSIGVMINFYRSRHRLKFELNHEAITRAGLKLPAKVLRLGRRVRQ